MFKNLLIDWVTELNEKIATVGDSGYLTISLSAFNPTLGASNRLREERNGNYVYLSPGHVIFFRNYNPAE